MTAQAFDEAFERVKDLAATFKANEARYLSAEYQEAEARKDFIDKFFIALGWDVNHDVQTNPYAQEVKVERAHGGTQRKADYAFYLAPNFSDVRFYVEAKKPHGDIATADNYFQTIRYGSGSRTPLAVLTDFEQFHILDSRFKADIQTALKRCVRRFHYSDYSDPESFAEIYWLFSREALTGGFLEKKAATLPRRGKDIPPPHLQSIDDAFLDELEKYRETLAHAFKNRNPRLDSETLTEATQRTLDRLVFMRFLEDKLIEPTNLVAGLAEADSAWPDFIAASRRLDNIYNGIVFKQHGVLDAPGFRVDNDAFAYICQRLSDEHSPYNFDAIPIHILGSIYERFLGNVIVATDKRVRVEPKPEVRKAGGVYYTPEYIVRYIVENTVGKLIAGKTPDQIAEMRFADIACGSGSFLLGVYDLLLQYHGNYYNANPKKARKGDCVERDGKLYLSLLKKREILLKNIYGVDIDTQAVEVCQLSLFLRLLKDETTGSTHQYLLEFAHTARLKKLLPDLGKNIVSGNSLIGTDILEGQLFAGDEERKLNPMNFEDAFPEVMKRGGFDAIVGNPPYVRAVRMGGEKAYYGSMYRAASGAYDIYGIFIERAIQVATTGGRIGLITPNKYFVADYARALRALILSQASVVEIADLGKCKSVFEGALISTAVTILEKGPQRRQVGVLILNDHNVGQISKIPASSTDLTQIISPVDGTIQIYRTPESKSLLEKISSFSVPLKDVAYVRTGVMGFDYWAMKKWISDKNNGPRIATNSYIDRYCFLWGKKIRIYEKDFRRPRLDPHCDAINEQTLDFFKTPKIVVRGVARRVTAMLDREGVGLLVAVHGIVPHSFDCRFLLGLLNSNFFNWLHVTSFYSARIPEGSLRYPVSFFSNLPIRKLDLSEPNGKQLHDSMVAKVEAMLEAKKHLAKAKTDKDKTYFENKCAALDRQIDRLVYDLYGLNEEEIRIVEGGK